MIVKSLILRCDAQRAFVLFTEHAGSCWPSQCRHTEDAASEIRFEAAGPFFERAADGTQVELDRVRTFEPGRRLIIDWYPEPARSIRREVKPPSSPRCRHARDDST